MDSITYTVQGIPPSDNQFKGRHNVWEYRSQKKAWGEYVRLATLGNRPPEPIKHAMVGIMYRFPDMRRRDPDNYCGKAILDGLVGAGVIADDSFRNVELRLCAEFGCPEPMTEITVQRLKEAKHT